MFHKVFFLGVMSLCSLHPADSSKAATTCTAPSVAEGDSTNVTCYFSQDVTEKHLNIKIVYRPLGKDSGQPENLQEILACYWLTSTNLSCKAQAGYQLLGHVTESAVLSIPKARPEHEGQYVCQARPPPPDDVYYSCDLRLHADTVEDTSSWGTGPIVTVSVLAAILVLAFQMVLIYVARKRFFCACIQESAAFNICQKEEQKPKAPLL